MALEFQAMLEAVVLHTRSFQTSVCYCAAGASDLLRAVSWGHSFLS